MLLRDKLRLRHIHFGLDHMLHAERQIAHGDLLLHAIVDAVDVLVIEAGQVENRFPHGLAGNGARVDADAANYFAAFDECYVLSSLWRPGWRLAGPLVPSRSRSGHSAAWVNAIVLYAFGAW